MREHLLDYAKSNHDTLAEELKAQLSIRRITLQQYFVMMECGATLGAELTLLILARMFNISISVVRGDFIWLSENMECSKCDVVVVQNCDGHFVGTKRLDGRVVNVGNVPKYQVNRKKSPALIGTSTPKEGVALGIKSQVAEPTVSPIVEQEDRDKSKESGFEWNEESEGENIGKVNKEDVKGTCKDDHDVDGPKLIKLNIKDIGNDTSSDSLEKGNETSGLGVLTPKSSSAVDVTSPEICNSTISQSEAVTPANGSFSTEYEENTQKRIKRESEGLADDEASNSIVFSSQTMDYTSETDGVGLDGDISQVSLMEKTVDSQETVDGNVEERKTEISEIKRSSAEEQSEFSENKAAVKRKRLGSTGPVTKVVKRMTCSNESVQKDDDSTEKYTEYSVVKLGCNKCSEIYYSNGAYNKHLFDKHRIHNPSRHPPTVINQIWSRIPAMKPLSSNEHECNLCKARFCEYVNLIKHQESCRPRTVEEEEEKQYSLYNLVESQQTEKKYEEERAEAAAAEAQKNSDDVDIVEPTEKTSCRCGRSQKRNWTHTKQRSRKSSDESDVPSRRYVRKPIDKSKLDDSKDKKDNVEYYKEVLGRYKTAPMKEQPSSSTVTSAESKHTTDTDFKLSTTGNSTTDSTNEESLPVIAMPKIKYQLRSMKKNDDEAQNRSNVDEETESTLTGEENVKGSDSNAEQDSIAPSKSDNSTDKDSNKNKSEISDLKLPPNRRSLTKLEIVDAMKMRTRQSVKKSVNERPKEEINSSVSDKVKSKKSKEDKVKKSEITDNSANDNPRSINTARVDQYLAQRAAKKSEEEEKSKSEKKQPIKRKAQGKIDDVTSKKPKPSAGKVCRNNTPTASKEAPLQSEISEEPSRMRTRSQKDTDEKSKQTSNEDTKSASEVEEQVSEYFSCKVCSQSFSNHDSYKKHKKSCTNITKRHICTKCSKSFSQKSLLTQHFDYRHTNKPKKFICEPCGKSFELKKSLQEHNHRLHDESVQKYLCDFCSRDFWHFGEFTMHRASHTGLKPYNCGRCQQKSFTSADRLKKHLERCGTEITLKCNRCGKGYSNPASLATHVRDVHQPETIWQCPFCEKKYNTEGGYYGHLRNIHDISRTGKKLSTALIEKFSTEQKANMAKMSKNDSNTGKKAGKENEGENSEKGRTEDANENKKSGKNAEG